MRSILDNQIPMREEFEVLYNKIVIKPITTILKKLKATKEENVAKSNNSTSASGQSEKLTQNPNDSLDLENEDFI